MVRAKNSKFHGGVSVDHSKQLPRLRRIEGQVRGLQKMIEGERNCLDIAHQITAVVAALRRVQGDMVRDHLAACVKATTGDKLTQAERSELAEEIGRLLAKSG